MKIEKIDGVTVIKASEGKIFRRIADNLDFGKEVWLGKTYMIGDEVLEEPKEEVPSDFIEIDEPIVTEVEDGASV